MKYFFLCLALVGLSWFGYQKLRPIQQEITYESRPIEMKGFVQSMVGPTDEQQLKLGGWKKGKMWLTGMRVAAVDATTGKERPLNNLCHTAAYRSQDSQFGVMFPGVHRIQFPKNFAMPFDASETLMFNSMGFNQNAKSDPPAQKFRLTMEYIADEDAPKNIRPLYHRMYRLFLPTLKKGEDHCADMGPDQMAESAAQVSGNYSAHFMVPPGRHVYRHILTGGLNIPRDTTVHYIYAHLHQYGKYVELRDVFENKTIFKATAHYDETGTFIMKSDIYSSEEGIPVYRDRMYELISEYDNRSDKSVDAMAMMYLYFAENGPEQRRTAQAE